ncbi:4-hydroxythreonine-4-phosphate dehydrogenase PdxA [Streptomyces sp. NPDC005962]|uniref:4-hydroxythreonine-4-phosphate dehydrogenase PdxA n=1 Tax=Streptomyces sp. NPDC005962 TaxID=3154466 RepID=UPI00340341F2
MEIPPFRRLLAIADDLSGAAETAAGLRSRTTRSQVLLLGPSGARPEEPAATDPHAVTVLDLDSRHLPAEAAADAVRAALRSVSTSASTSTSTSDTLVLKKIDSLLRGNVAAEVAALAADGTGVIVAPALPVAGRVVRAGVVHVGGVPLHEGDAWHAEATSPPSSVAGALGGLPTEPIPLATVRAPRPALLSALRAAVAAGRVAVCDAETDADLDAIVEAALADGPHPHLVGTGGLATALGRHLTTADWPTTLDAGPTTADSATRADTATRPETVAAAAHAEAAARVGTAARPGTTDAAPCGETAPPAEAVAAADPPLLVVVGTAEPGAVEQVRRLVADGAVHIPLDLTGLLADPPMAALPPPTAPVTVVTIAPAAGPRGAAPGPPPARRLVRALARVVAGALGAGGGRGDLVLTGGETARQVLDALAITRLDPVGQVHHGAVQLRTPDGRSVVTRPGSFGDPDSLRHIVRALRPHTRTEGPSMPPKNPSTNPEPTGPLPLIAVTMGDGAGIGPEVIVPALLAPETLRRCRPVVVGDAERLRQAARLRAIACEIVTVGAPAEAEFTPGRINIIDLGLLPAELPWGELSAVAGDAAYQYIRAAARLAMDGEVQGICTAPLNKGALHAAGHIFPGHTELLAHLTGVEEVSMMLATPTVKVIHVTTHIGLIDAVNRIEPGLVERTVRRGHDAMVRAGTPEPVIGVCGINPHAGENGLFGYGEEEEKIVPALEVLRKDGIDARGPLPADTAFFLAGRGDYDLIVAMYHDQGHGPVKVLGLEAGVNLTVGLPVIRTSVDHGTAFDIAGTGKADAGSMIEALRQAAEMSPSPTR